MLGGALSVIIFSFFMIHSLIKSNPKDTAHELLGLADIHVDGTRPWDITVHNDAFYTRALSQGSLGLGEAYMDGWWDCPHLDQFFYKISDAQLPNKVSLTLSNCFAFLKAKCINLQSKSRAFEVGEQHYDLSNDLFAHMLDPRMVYSCAYWKDTSDLNTAQEQKLDLICKKLDLKPGMKLLDIGCGWGSFSRYAAEKYGVQVVGISISKEQVAYACQACKNLPVEIRLQDYRDLNETFDRIVSIGMFEHVGYKNYDTFMNITAKLLKDDGLMMLHTIGSNSSHIRGDDWINKYIFPNGMLPSIAQIGKSIEGLFVMEDWHNFGSDYDKTLMAWHDNFEKNWNTLQSNFDNRFYRMWKYYLLSCAGLFRARAIQLWQVVLSKKGTPGGYITVR